MRFLVQTEDEDFLADPEGFRSRDREDAVSRLRKIAETNGLPYEDVFVSLHVEHEGLEPIQGQRILKGYKLIEEFGSLTIELRPEIVEAIDVVCAGDYQNILLWSQNKQPGYLGEMVCSLAGMSSDQKLARCEAFIVKAKANFKMGYAEARIFRTLKTSDKVR